MSIAGQIVRVSNEVGDQYTLILALINALNSKGFTYIDPDTDGTPIENNTEYLRALLDAVNNNIHVSLIDTDGKKFFTSENEEFVVLL